jgi:5-(hydroxymethyl)furfural/furfural oxidase
MQNSATHIIIGGGTAGCVVASRLSDSPSNRVLLLEAGHDFGPADTPVELNDVCNSLVMTNPHYFWNNIKVSRGSGDPIPKASRKPYHYSQGKVIGGGSAINGQVSLRGTPFDYDTWAELGADGWDYETVLPYFRKLERDLNFQDHYHGDSGPVAIRRAPKSEWDPFTLAVARDWERQGHRFILDMNGKYADGYGAVPLSHDGRQRMSTSTCYLSDAVRRRNNLHIFGNAEVRRILFEGRQVVGVEYVRDGRKDMASARDIVLSAGALNSPKILMLSGVGPQDHLRAYGIDVVTDRAGVGEHLQDHPLVSVSAYLPASARPGLNTHQNYSYLRYTSDTLDCAPSDMVMMAASRSSWHAIGARIATLSSYLAAPYSLGRLRLVSADPKAAADISFEWLSDPRDRERLVNAFATMADMLLQGEASGQCSDPFPSTFSGRVAAASLPTVPNRVIIGAGAIALDGPGPLRRFLMNNVVREAPDLRMLKNNREEMDEYVCSSVRSASHASGTCRMGAEDEETSVVDPKGRVIGVGGLWVADASIMPQISRNNTNLPTIMIGEKVADLIAEDARER